MIGALLNAAVCRLAGHDWSWIEGLGAGLDRPRCRRCKAVG